MSCTENATTASSLRWLGLAWLFLVCASAPAAVAGTITYNFTDSLEGWETGWHKDSTTGTTGTVSWSAERGSGDGGPGSLKFDMGDGFGDDGTLWIARRFPAPAGVTAPMTVSFDLYSEEESFVNNFQVKATIRPDKPDRQNDFVTIGETNTAAGWVPYSYTRTLTSQTGSVWVAVGIRVAWESHRDYWIDGVSVTGVAVPEPAGCTILLMLAGLAANSRRSRSSGAAGEVSTS